MGRFGTLAVTAMVLGVTAPITVPFLGQVAEAQVRVGPSSAEDCDNAVDVQADQNACSQTVAVSVAGSASGNCQGNNDGQHPVSCITVSGIGDAENEGGT